MISQCLNYFAFIVGEKLGGHDTKILDIGIWILNTACLFNSLPSAVLLSAMGFYCQSLSAAVACNLRLNEQGAYYLCSVSFWLDASLEVTVSPVLW